MSERQPDNVQFLLNDQQVTVSQVAADQTLLIHLREQQRLRGTKEGCAEGDCGACTVLIGRLLRGQLVYESVNACIRLLASVHACHVVTIEYLEASHSEESGYTLHPVQQAMVDEHGSQCGFCTPGIVMSLYALWLNESAPDERTIKRSLQGNLCRCTGYAPIIRAAQSAARIESRSNDKLYLNGKSVTEQLARMESVEPLAFSDGKSYWFRPATLDDATDALKNHSDATILAGSTDVGLWVTKSFQNISPVVSLSHLDDLHEITIGDEAITLGACVTYSEAANVLLTEIPELSEYWYRIGGEQVRNMGTIGGNVANGSPIGDTPPVLLALGATLLLRSSNGSRILPINEYFIEYGVQNRQTGEFIQSIEIPLPNAVSRFAAYKISKRRDEDISSVCCAYKMTVRDDVISDAKIAYGGMAGIPLRAEATETLLKGKPWQQNTIDDACESLRNEFTPLSDWRASADYRREVCANLLQRFFNDY